MPKPYCAVYQYDATLTSPTRATFTTHHVYSFGLMTPLLVFRPRWVAWPLSLIHWLVVGWLLLPSVLVHLSSCLAQLCSVHCPCYSPVHFLLLALLFLAHFPSFLIASLCVLAVLRQAVRLLLRWSLSPHNVIMSDTDVSCYRAIWTWNESLSSLIDLLNTLLHRCG